MPAHTAQPGSSAHRPAQLATMLDWLTHDSQAYAAANGYVPLPAQIQQLAGPTGTLLPS